MSLFYDQAFIKEPGTREVTQWHQDLPFWPALGTDIISLWVALTPVTLEGSGVEYVAGSHKWGKFYQAITPDKDSKFANAALEPCPDFSLHKGDPQYRFLSWDCEPGDVICHHPLTVHGAGANPLIQPTGRHLGALRRPRRPLGSATERHENRRRAGAKASAGRTACAGRCVPDYLGACAR